MFGLYWIDCLVDRLIDYCIDWMDGYEKLTIFFRSSREEIRITSNRSKATYRGFSVRVS